MRVFLSSTYEDLVTHRQLAAQALERLGQQGIRMEVFGARPSEAMAVCFDEIADADALVGLYAHRYGFVPTGSSQSITEQEFDFARRSSKPTFCFVIDNEHPWPPRHIESEPGQSKLKGFKDWIRQQVVTDVFSSPEDLAYKLTAALGRFLLTAKVKTELDHIPGGDRVRTGARPFAGGAKGHAASRNHQRHSRIARQRRAGRDGARHRTPEGSSGGRAREHYV